MTSPIKDTIVRIVQEGLYRTGFMGLLHRYRNARTLTVLMFHRVLPRESSEFMRSEREFTFSIEGFCRCLDFLKHHYNVIDLDTLIDVENGRCVLPPFAALITFDDGWRDTVVHALPELQKRGLPAVLFVSTEIPRFATSRWWQDALVEIAGSSEYSQGLAQDLGLIPADQPDFHELSSILASMAPSEREALIVKYIPLHGERQMLSSADLASLNQKQLALAAHGHTHAPLTYVRELSEELEASAKHIRGLGGYATAMSLPHGDVDVRVLRSARKAGFEWIFTSVPALNSSDMPHKNRLLARIHVPENRWTCGVDNRISNARLANFLFLRPIQSSAYPEFRESDVRS
ncbi:MAG: polysaccharide deacetylase family protein [Desulfocapsaceae bacterium]|nr:polysaccharide deacetylase family protein [Desulfosporosinus sp.]MDR3629532.1 polysaccharide deacetylase family protein [Desulfocapsaceae bacterium]